MRWITPPDLTEPTGGRPNDWFIGREKELADIRALAAKPTGEHVPILAVKGVSGSGKTFLARRSREILRTAGIPVVTIDYAQIGQRFDHSEFVTSLLSATGIDAPRTFIALLYLAMREHELDHSEIEEELRIEKMGAAADLLFLNIQGVASGFLRAYGAYAYKKYKLSKEPINQFLKSDQGKELKRRMLNLDHYEIRNDLMGYFAADLNDNLVRPDFAVQFAVCVDSFDKAYAHNASSYERERTLEWISHLYLICNDKPEPVTNSRVLILCYGESDFIHAEVADHIQIHELRGFSRSDAAAYWKLKGLPEVHFESALREAKEESEGESYHVLSLDFVGEIVNADPNAKFDTGATLGQDRISTLAHRFLQLQSDSDCMNLRQLALASWWDDEAAAWVFGLQERQNDCIPKLKWLKRFSFVQEVSSGRYTLHGVMIKSLISTSEPSQKLMWHLKWKEYYWRKSESETDEYRAQYWRHFFVCSSEDAMRSWYISTERCSRTLRYWDHLWHVLIGEECICTPKYGFEIPCELLAEAMNHWGFAAARVAVGDAKAILYRSTDALELSATLSFEAKDMTGYGYALMNLGVAQVALGKLGDMRALIDARETSIRALSVASKAEQPVLWSGIQNNLGHILTLVARLYSASEEERSENVSAAISCLREALSTRALIGSWPEWAESQLNIGAAYRLLAEGGEDSYLLLAHDAYSKALGVLKVDEHPESWAMVVNNIGNVGIHFCVRGDEESCRNAADAYFLALKVRGKWRVPASWAETLDNLGVAQLYLGLAGDSKYIEEAIYCHRSALEVWDANSTPGQYANSIGKLGVALLRLAERSLDLELAIEACDCIERSRTAWESIGVKEMSANSDYFAEQARSLIQKLTSEKPRP